MQPGIANRDNRKQNIPGERAGKPIREKIELAGLSANSVRR
jgi:hypothetical protein